jgi:hypothetical protein
MRCQVLSFFIGMAKLCRQVEKPFSQPSFVRNDFFAVDHHMILYSIGKVEAAKFDETLGKVREFFS